MTAKQAGSGGLDCLKSFKTVKKKGESSLARQPAPWSRGAGQGGQVGAPGPSSQDRNWVQSSVSRRPLSLRPRNGGGRFGNSAAGQRAGLDSHQGPCSGAALSRSLLRSLRDEAWLVPVPSCSQEQSAMQVHVQVSRRPPLVKSSGSTVDKRLLARAPGLWFWDGRVTCRLQLDPQNRHFQRSSPRHSYTKRG